MSPSRRADAARLAAPFVQRLGESFMLQERTRAAGRRLGYAGWPFYFAGRGGVLGPAHPDVITAAMAFLPAEFVTAQWTAALAVGPIEPAVDAYLAQCHRWGRETLSGLPDLERLGDLAQRVIARAPRAGRSLFAGWAALPLPDDPVERAAQLLQVLREHRGAAHVLAVLGTGLDPLTAVLTDPASGAGVARYFRWPEPYPTPDATQRSAWQAAEARTNAMVGADLEVLDDDETDELLRLLAAAHEYAFDPERQAGTG